MSKVNPDDFFGPAAGTKSSVNPDDYFGPVAEKKPEPEGVMSRVGSAIKDAAIASASLVAGKDFAKPADESITADPLSRPSAEKPVKDDLLASRGNAPLSEEAFGQIKASLAAMPREQRQAAVSRKQLPNWMRGAMSEALRQIDLEDKGFDTSGAMSPQASVETRSKKLVAGGMEGQSADSWGAQDAQMGGITRQLGTMKATNNLLTGEEEDAAMAEGRQLSKDSVVIRGLYGAKQGLVQAGAGINAALLHAMGDTKGAKRFEKISAYREAAVNGANELANTRRLSQELGVIAETPADFWERMGVSGINSVGQMVPSLLAGGLISLGVGNAAVGAKVAMTLMSTQVFGQEFANPEAVQKLSPAERAGRAAIMTVAEYAGEQWGVLPAAMKAISKKAAAVELETLPQWTEKVFVALEKRGLLSKPMGAVARVQAGEVIGEEFTGGVQYLVDGTKLGLDKPVSFMGFMENARDVAVQTVIATTILQGAGGLGKGLLMNSRRPDDRIALEAAGQKEMETRAAQAAVPGVPVVQNPAGQQMPGVPNVALSPTAPVAPVAPNPATAAPFDAGALLGTPTDEAHAEQAKPTDLMTGDGMPYGSQAGAKARANKDGGEVVPVVGGWVVRPSVDTGVPQNSGDRLSADPKGDGNSGLTEAGQPQGFDSLGVNGKSMVKRSVLAAINDQQVLGSVVELVPVDVMNVLAGGELSAESLRRNPSVLLERLSSSFDDPVVATSVARFVDAVASSHPDAFAGLPAKVQAALGVGNSPRVNAESNPAGGAANVGSHSANYSEGGKDANRPDLAVPATQPTDSGAAGTPVPVGSSGPDGLRPADAGGGIQAPAADPVASGGEAVPAGVPAAQPASALSDTPDFESTWPAPIQNPDGKGSAFEGLEGEYLANAITGIHQEVGFSVQADAASARALIEGLGSGVDPATGKQADPERLKAMRQELRDALDGIDSTLGDYAGEFGDKHKQAFQDKLLPDLGDMLAQAEEIEKPGVDTKTDSRPPEDQNPIKKPVSDKAKRALEGIGKILKPAAEAPSVTSGVAVEPAPAAGTPEHWSKSEFAPRINAALNSLEDTGIAAAADLARVIRLGLDSEKKPIDEARATFTEDLVKREMSRWHPQAVPWEPMTLEALRAKDGVIKALPDPIVQAAVTRLNELGPRLARYGFKSQDDVKASHAVGANDIAREMREVVGALLGLAPARYSEAIQRKNVNPKTIGRAEDFASRVLNIDTRAHPGVDTTDIIGSGGAKKRAQKKAKQVSTHPKKVWGSTLLAEISRQKGGLSPDLLHDLSFRKETGKVMKNGKIQTAWFNPPVYGMKGGLFREGGLGDTNELAEWMEEEGYIPIGTMADDYKKGDELARTLVTKALNRDEPKTELEITNEADDYAKREREAWDALSDEEKAAAMAADGFYPELDPEAAEEAEAERRAIMEEQDVSAVLMDAGEDSDIDFDSPVSVTTGAAAMRASGLFSEQEIADAEAEEAAQQRSQAVDQETGVYGPDGEGAPAAPGAPAPRPADDGTVQEVAFPDAVAYNDARMRLRKTIDGTVSKLTPEQVSMVAARLQMREGMATEMKRALMATRSLEDVIGALKAERIDPHDPTVMYGDSFSRAPGAEPLLQSHDAQDLESKAAREEEAKRAEQAEQRSLAAKEAARKRALNQAEEAARAEQIRKERADAAVDGFELGQEPPSAVVTHTEAAGQGDIFGVSQVAPNRDETLVALRKRLSVLKSLRECLG